LSISKVFPPKKCASTLEITGVDKIKPMAEMMQVRIINNLCREPINNVE
jgi:hypothetical protein